MPDLQFNNVKLHNFKSFPEAELDLRASGIGLHFLKGRNKKEPRLGSNGSGKTSLWDAIGWCLYGRTSDGLRGTDIRSWSATGPTQVEVEVTVDGEERLISRSASPNSMNLDGKAVGQEDIDALIGIEADTFYHTILLGQGQSLFFDLPPRQKLDLLSTVLNLDRWDERAEGASKKVQSLLLLQSKLNGNREGLTAQLDVNTKELERLHLRSDEWAEEHRRKMDNLEKEVQEAKSRLEKVAEQVDLADLAYDGAMTELKQLEKDHDRIMHQLHDAKVEEEKVNLEVDTWREEKRKIAKELNSLPDVCPTCGQPLGGTQRFEYKAKLRARLEEVEVKVKEWEGASAQHRQQTEEISKSEKRMTAEMIGFRVKAEDAQSILETAGRVKIELQQLLLHREEMEKQYQSEENPYQEQIKIQRREGKRLGAELRELEERFERLSGQIERTRYWIKGFRDVRLYVVDEVLQELQLTTNALLAEVGLDDWQVFYDIERQTKSGTVQRGLNVTILSPGNERPVRWEVWSGGEGQRLRLIGALALADVLLSYANVRTDFEVLDEPTQHLSTEGVNDLVDFLMNRAVQCRKSIWLVDHKIIEGARFQTVATVVKDERGSHLVH